MERRSRPWNERRTDGDLDFRRQSPHARDPLPGDRTPTRRQGHPGAPDGDRRLVRPAGHDAEPHSDWTARRRPPHLCALWRPRANHRQSDGVGDARPVRFLQLGLAPLVARHLQVHRVPTSSGDRKRSALVDGSEAYLCAVFRWIAGLRDADSSQRGPGAVKFLCPACERLTAFSGFRVDGDLLMLRCSRCGVESRSSAAAAEQDPIAIGLAQGAPSAPASTLSCEAAPTAISPTEIPAPSADASSVPEGYCPKCIAVRPAQASACAQCGLVFANFKPEELEPSPPIAEQFQRLVSNWENIEEHDRLL